jgi:hypothetical protein
MPFVTKAVQALLIAKVAVVDGEVT